MTAGSSLPAVFLRAEKDGRLVNIREELPKSFIVTEDPGKKVYVSQLSVGALIGRSREGE